VHDRHTDACFTFPQLDRISTTTPQNSIYSSVWALAEVLEHSRIIQIPPKLVFRSHRWQMAFLFSIVGVEDCLSSTTLTGCRGIAV